MPETTNPTQQAPAAAPASAQGGFKPQSREITRGGRRPHHRQERERVKPEYDHKILNIRRVTRVASGGRRFSFSVAVIIGNRNGAVGVGTGKAIDTTLAIEKAIRQAKKGLIKVTLTPERSLPHMTMAKYNSAQVVLMPAPGRGLIAGSAVRTVCEYAGIKDVNAKILSGSKNQLNIARAALIALQELLPVKEKKMKPVAEEKSKKVLKAKS